MRRDAEQPSPLDDHLVAPSVGLATSMDGGVVATRLGCLTVQTAAHELAADTLGELESSLSFGV